MSSPGVQTDAPPEATGSRHVRVFRYKRGQPGSHFDTFDVPVGDMDPKRHF